MLRQISEEKDESEPLVEGDSFLTDYGTSSRKLQVAKSINDEDSEAISPSVLTQSVDSINVPAGSLNLLNSRYESLDYDTCENHLLLDEERTKGYPFVIKKNLMRWVIFLMIGIITALIGCLIDICIEELSNRKYKTLSQYMDQCMSEHCLYKPYLLWTVLNGIPVMIGSILVCFVEPIAAGSGIPQVKCYLNGVKIPRVVRIRTLFVKVLGVIGSVVGGLAGGKEGPMVHSGAIIAAGISQGKSTTFQKDFKLFKYFREDHEKRDFVSGGAAAGVAAAFGAPVGGVLFSLEEGTSFWNQSLTWRIFFASCVSTFTLNLVLSTYHGHPGELSYAGLLNFGQFDPQSISYSFQELPVFMLMGAIGGLSGSLFNQINFYLTVFRIRYIRSRFLKVLEAVLVAISTATLGFLMIYSLDDCRPLGQDPTRSPVQMTCGDGEYSAVGAIWFQTPEASVRSLFHDPAGSHKPLTLSLFFIFYYLLSIWTYGLSVSSGLFIPSLLTGAAWGRLVGVAMQAIFPNAGLDAGKYALVGAAAQLGGVVRMTISLTVILIEATGNITFGLPLMLTLMVAKWVGDFYNEGLYDIHIQLSGVPLLPWEPPPLSTTVYASEVMSHPVATLKTIERVGAIIQLLKEETYNGFPVVDPEPASPSAVPAPNHSTSTNATINRRRYETLRGLILRSQLIVLLKNKVFNETADIWTFRKLSVRMFRDEYPRYPTIEDLNILPEELNYTIDLRPFLNPSPYTVQHLTSLSRLFRLFRALGLRHLVVVNDTNQVVGIVTRKDLARYRVWRHRGRMGLDQLFVSE